MNSNRLLVIGASGLVGRHILRSCLKEGWNAQGTYSTRKEEGLIHLDLTKTESSKLNFADYSHVLIAAGMSNIDQCSLNQDVSNQVNVLGIKKILQAMKTGSAIPIFLSTDYVFEGKNGNYKEDDVRKPATVYGKQKVEIEDFVMKEFKKFLILRLGKVVSHDPQDQTFLTDWFLKLSKGEKVRAAEDQTSSLLEISDMLKAFHFILEGKLQGTYHIANGIPSSKLEIAHGISKRFNLDSSVIIPCRINELGLRERRPLNTSLNSENFRKLSGLRFKQLNEILDDLLICPRN